MRKGTMHPTATANPPETVDSTRRIFPRALSDAPMAIEGVKCTVSSTGEPFRIKRSVEKRIPPLLIFSERAEI